jgi:ATP-dependent helicase/nuclease subunit B
MPVERHFLGWDAPLTAGVREFLLPADLSGPADLGGLLIVVPTRQAGRRLREELALFCAGRQTALLSPRVEMPAFFFRTEERRPGVAAPTEVAAAWAAVLLEANLEEYNGLFPGQAPEKTFPWAVQTGDAIQHLRKELVDGGHGIADVREEFGGVLEEPERWRDLARLEGAYLERLEARGLRDPYVLMIERSAAPALPEGLERIVVAAVPDPPPVTVRALERLAERVPVDILIHAPESHSALFDEWGRPVAEKWRESLLEIPDPEENILLAGSPPSQSGRAL